MEEEARGVDVEEEAGGLDVEEEAGGWGRTCSEVWLPLPCSRTIGISIEFSTTAKFCLTV